MAKLTVVFVFPSVGTGHVPDMKTSLEHFTLICFNDIAFRYDTTSCRSITIAGTDLSYSVDIAIAILFPQNVYKNLKSRTNTQR